MNRRIAGANKIQEPSRVLSSTITGPEADSEALTLVAEARDSRKQEFTRQRRQA